MLASLVLVGCLFAAQPATDDAALKTEVRQLVKKLDADKLPEREAAEARLLALGPSALDLLPDASDVASEEVKQRLGRIRQKLQQQMAEAAVQASLVTLKGPMPLSKALAAMQQQTGNQIVDPRHAAGEAATDPQVSPSFDKTPFWSALDVLVDQAKLSVYPFGRPDALQIVPRAADQLPRAGRAVVMGPLRIEPVRVVATRDLRTTGNSSLLVMTELAWEPRLHPIGLKQRMADVKAVGDDGQPLAIEDPEAEKEAFPGRAASAVEMEVRLVAPGRPIKHIASLQGAFQAMLPGRVETFRFTDVLHAKKVEKRIAAATVVLDEVRRNGDNWEVYVRLKFDDAGDAFESHRNWALQNEVYFEGPDGKPIPFDSMETTERTKNEIGIGYVFAMEKPPEKLPFVYKTPGTIVTKKFSYELKGIKLP